jgi:hypothetical protein
MFAVKMFDAQELLKLLLEHGADISLRNDSGRTVFDLNELGRAGQQQEYRNILQTVKPMQVTGEAKALLSKPAAPSPVVVPSLPKQVKQPAGLTLEKQSALNAELDTALRAFGENPTGSMRDIRRLLAQRADVNARFEGGYTPLMVAVKMFDTQELLKLLLEQGADTSLRNDSGRTVFDLITIGSSGLQTEYRNILQGIKP